MVDDPAVTVPSSGTRSPGRTNMTPPRSTSPVATSTQPSPERTCATSGASSTRLRIACRARSRLNASISSATPNNQITTAASGHCPMEKAPITATDINKFIVKRRDRNACQPLRNVSRPPTTTATTAMTATISERSSPIATATISDPSANTPAIPVSTRDRTGRRRSWFPSATGITSDGRIPESRIACTIGSTDTRSWVTVTRRATRSNDNERTPTRPPSASRSSASSVAQSSSSTRNVDTPRPPTTAAAGRVTGAAQQSSPPANASTLSRSALIGHARLACGRPQTRRLRVADVIDRHVQQHPYMRISEPVVDPASIAPCADHVGGT